MRPHFALQIFTFIFTPLSRGANANASCRALRLDGDELRPLCRICKRSFPKGHVTLTVDALSPTSLSLACSGCGNLKAFASELTQAGFVRKTMKLQPEDQYSKVFYFLDQLKPHDKLLTEFEKVVMADIFHNAPIRVSFRSEKANDEAVAVLRAKLTEFDTLMIL